ncbi:hypothetical protein [Flavobacterium sp. 7A]|uniref:hypothetical protein n=1 Tax=Flavobacterium sp. 7A TaxID=2940571 RepID=UPI002227E684|nr:hypothetical protein [Flavobacterium sp. 7A]MCW2119855.1 hypothetical protein [Flavobacterium sp. 7A]
MTLNKSNVLLLLTLISSCVSAQVKIGDNPSVINGNSLLELESTNKVLVLSRLTSAQMNAIIPLHGALIYNTDEKCIFMFQEVSWKSLCVNGTAVTTATVAPTINNIGDFWVNNSKARDIISVWNGSTWIPINSNPKSGLGNPNSQVDLSPKIGDIYIDETNGDIYIYNGTTWANYTANSKVSVANGLTIDAGNTIQLGGTLTKETTITTNGSNTLAITGLEDTIDIDANNIIVVNKATGTLKRIEASALLREEEIVITATNGQSQFSPPYPIANPKQIDVYRNGVRIAFTVVNTTTIELEAEAICYQGDKIRIVQFY